MANLVRRGVLDDPFEDLFKGFFVRPLSFEAPQTAQFRMDVTENENAYRVKADLPGVRREDLNVTIDGDTVTIAAEVRSEKEAKNGDRVVRTERYIGKIARSFALGQPIEEAGAEAKLTDGVLELVLPKKAAPSGRKLTIN